MAIIDKKPVIRLILKVILAHTCVKIKVNDIVLYLVFVLFLKRKKKLWGVGKTKVIWKNHLFVGGYAKMIHL